MFNLTVFSDDGDEVFSEDYQTRGQAVRAGDDLLDVSRGYFAAIENLDTGDSIFNDNSGVGWSGLDGDL